MVQYSSAKVRNGHNLKKGSQVPCHQSLQSGIIHCAAVWVITLCYIFSVKHSDGLITCVDHCYTTGMPDTPQGIAEKGLLLMAASAGNCVLGIGIALC